LRLLFLVIVVDLIGFAAILPSLPFYAEYYGAGPDTVALVIATYSFCNFLVAPFWGRLSDRVGRKPVLLISFAGSIVSYLALALAGSLTALFVARALAGFLTANLIAAQAYVSDITTPTGRARGMGMIGAAFGVAFVIGPTVGGLIVGGDATPAAYARPAFLASGLSGLALVLALFLLAESRGRGADGALSEAAMGNGRLGRLAVFLRSFRHPILALLIGISFFTAFVFASMESTFALWAERALAWGPREVGYAFAFAGLVAAVTQGGLVGPLSRRFGEPVLLAQAAIALGLGMVLIPLAGGLVVLLVGVGLLAFGIGIGNPSLQSLVSKQAAADQRGGALGVNQSAASFARIVGPAWAGLLFAQFGRAAPYYAAVAVAALALLLALRLIARVAVLPAAAPGADEP